MVAALLIAEVAFWGCLFKFTSVRTTAAGRERMVKLVMQVPGDWSVAQAPFWDQSR